MSEEVKNELSEKEQAILAKLAQAKTVEEVQSIVKENGGEATEEQAKELFEKLKAAGTSGELSDDELDNVAGGYEYGTPEFFRSPEYLAMCAMLARMHCGG